MENTPNKPKTTATTTPKKHPSKTSKLCLKKVIFRTIWWDLSGHPKILGIFPKTWLIFGMVSCSLGPEPSHFNNKIKQTCKTDNFLLSRALFCSLIHARCLFCSGAVLPAAQFSRAQPGPADPAQNQAVIQTPKQEAQHQLSHPGLKVQSPATW